MIKILPILIFSIICLLSNYQNTRANNIVNIIQVPEGCLVPDVQMDNNGVLHGVYAYNQDAYYFRSTDNGNTFTAPVKVNNSGTVEFKMGERGPKLAVGADGVIHVVWMDIWSTDVKVYARYTRSIDGGKTFENPKAVSSTSGVDGVTVAADNKNHVFVFWHTMVPVQTTIPQATWLHFANSSDNGVNFSKDTNLVINNHSGLACTMCMTRARFGLDGNIYLAFRSAENNIRDFYVIKGDASGTNFSAMRVNTDNWNIEYCPMVGPELEICKDNKQYCAYMSENHVYWSVSNSDMTAFLKHIATPLNELDEIFPTALSNNSGKVLFLWQVGPMSISDSATVNWAIYDTSGNFTGQQGTVGRTSSGTKSTAYVGTDDNFYIVICADSLTSVEINSNKSNIYIQPNPTDDFINITGINKKILIRLFDISGELILDKEIYGDTNLDISFLSSGVYFLKAGNQSFEFVIK